jgi:hypothetical protein
MCTRMMRRPTRRALGGKRGHCSVGAVHGGEGDNPILAPQGPATVKTLTRH